MTFIVEPHTSHFPPPKNEKGEIRVSLNQELYDSSNYLLSFFVLVPSFCVDFYIRTLFISFVRTYFL